MQLFDYLLLMKQKHQWPYMMKLKTVIQDRNQGHLPDQYSLQDHLK